MVMSVPTTLRGKTLQFNLKYTHTYLTTNRNETWSANLSWDSFVKGVASYSVQMSTSEQQWSKGKFLSFVW